MFCGCNEQRSSTETIVEHYIEDISTEGATASTLYRNNKIISTTIEIFGETGKRTICYAYEKEYIAAIESTFTYNYLIYRTPDTTIPSQKKRPHRHHYSHSLQTRLFRKYNLERRLVA